MKPFQAALLVAFGLLALFAVFIFASFTGSSRSAVGTVVIWGTLPQPTMDELLGSLRGKGGEYDKVSYKEFKKPTFTTTLVDAIASGQGPDLILFSADEVLSDSDKVLPISYNSLSRRTFQDSFIEAGEIYLTPTGILGIPFYVDPAVLYWNRTRFSAAGIPRPPRYWDELTDMAPKLSKVSEAGFLTQSAAALGEWSNVEHAKGIFLSLVRGLGNSVVVLSDKGVPTSVLGDTNGLPVAPAESALRFFTDFSDPVKPVYSWNRSQPSSRSAFLAGTLATYVGLASEAAPLRAANPNLDFDLAAYPSIRGGIVAVPAEVLALSVPRGSKNPTGALKVALLMSGVDAQKKLSAITTLPSVRRDVLPLSPNNPYESIFRDAALNAFSFLDPEPAKTDAIFRSMVEDVSSGRASPAKAVQSGQEALRALIKVR